MALYQLIDYKNKLINTIVLDFYFRNAVLCINLYLIRMLLQ